MKFRTAAAALLLCSAAPLAAYDLPDWHAGVHYADAQFSPDGAGEENVNDLNFKLGMAINPGLSVEAHFGTDVASDSENNDSGDGATYLAAFARKDIRLERVNFFGLLGAAAGNADYGNNFDDSFAGLAFGAGVELFGSPRTAVSLQFVQYGTDDSYKTIGAGLVHYFEWSDIR